MKLDESSKKDCNTCKCLTCKSGSIFPDPCPLGNNCDICKKCAELPNHKDDCQSYVSGY